MQQPQTRAVRQCLEQLFQRISFWGRSHEESVTDIYALTNMFKGI